MRKQRLTNEKSSARSSVLELLTSKITDPQTLQDIANVLRYPLETDSMTRCVEDT